jgi:hypothetical protein
VPQQHREIAAFLRTRKGLGQAVFVDNSTEAAGTPLIRIYGSA